MKTFLGIGVSHEDDVFDFVYSILSKYKSQSITIEKKMNFTNVGESCIHEEKRREKLYTKKSKIRYEKDVGDAIIRPFDSRPPIIHHNVRRAKLYLDELCVLDGQDLEFNPVLYYSLNKNVPFYFVDIPLYGTRDIVEFRPNDYQVIPLGGKDELTKCSPPEHLLLNSATDISKLYLIHQQYNSITRNKFAADAINFLFEKNLNCVIHVGGISHFNVQYLQTGKWEPYDEDWQAHIQDFVEADRIIIADSCTRKIHKLR